MGYLCVNNSVDTIQQRKSKVLLEFGAEEMICLEGAWNLSRTVRGRKDLPGGKEGMNGWEIWGPANRWVCLGCKKCQGEQRRKAGCVARAQVGEVFGN